MVTIELHAALVTTALLWTLVRPGQGKPSEPPNLIYTVSGYDAVQGNPHAHIVDPGFSIRFPIFKLQYTHNNVTNNGQWLQPDYVQIYSVEDCSSETDSQIISDAISYQSLLKVDASINVGSLPFQFAGNAAFQDVADRTTGKSMDYVIAQTKCAFYTAKINPYSKISLTDEFSAAVRALPLNQNLTTPYLAFFALFGTHYATSTDMGAKIVATSQIDRSTMSSLMQCDVGVDVMASVMLPTMFSASASANTQTKQSVQTSFNQKRTVTVVSIQGAPPTSGQSMADWAQSAKTNPYPIRYQLSPLTDLMTQAFFPDLRSTELTTKVTLMTSAYSAYCTSLGSNCAIPSSPAKTPSTNSTQVSTGHKACNVAGQGVKTENNHVIIAVVAVGLCRCLKI